MVRIESFERGHAHQAITFSGGEEGHRGIAELVRVKGERVLRRRGRSRRIDVDGEECSDVFSANVVDGDPELHAAFWRHRAGRRSGH
jgi:hypothetical protein